MSVRQLYRHRLKLLAICGIVGTLASGAATLVLASSPWGSAAVMLTVASLSFIAVYLAWQIERRSNAVLRLLKQVRETNAPILEELSRISYRTAPVWDLSGSVVKLRRDVDALPDRLQADTARPQEEKSPAVGDGGPFSPHLIQTFTPQVPSPNAAVGRNAAARVGDPHSPEKYAALLDGNPEESEALPAVLAVTAPDFGARMAAYADVTMARPETASLDADHRFAYLVVDDSAFGSGPWFGADSAENTAQYLRLRDLIGKANAQGMISVLVERSGRAGHLTSELQKQCRMVVDADFASVSHDQALPLLIRNLIESCEFRSTSR